MRENDRYHLHVQALSVGGVAKMVFKPELDDLSCREQDWACGVKEMSFDAIGVE